MDKKASRIRRSRRARAKIASLGVNRLCVHRTPRHTYAQVFSGETGKVVAAASTLSADVKKGLRPMEEKHVWWMVNPNSRNLRTLQRYNGKDTNNSGTNSNAKTIQVDRGSKNKGLRLSLIAGYMDPRTGKLRELTLTRCIEIWGHVPFTATDMEFEEMMTAIERVNAGQPPPPFQALGQQQQRQQQDLVSPGRVGNDANQGEPQVLLHQPIDLEHTQT